MFKLYRSTSEQASLPAVENGKILMQFYPQRKLMKRLESSLRGDGFPQRIPQYFVLTHLRPDGKPFPLKHKDELTVESPLSYGPVSMKHAGHRLGPTERVLG